MRSFAALFAMSLALAANPIAAREYVVEVVEVEYVVWHGEGGTERFVSDHIAQQHPDSLPQGIAAYGPFRVLDGSRAALVDATDSRSPEAFSAMLRDYPAIGLLEMVDCPGTEDDQANLRLGRMIRDKGIATYVPARGSVRSGAVELFLAGARRLADPGAEFAVHAWMDDTGREATDYALTAPENAKYLAYYRHMGMSPTQAAAFYDMTNSVPHHEAKWLNRSQMALWVSLDSDS